MSATLRGAAKSTPVATCCCCCRRRRCCCCCCARPVSAFLRAPPPPLAGASEQQQLSRRQINSVAVLSIRSHAEQSGDKLWTSARRVAASAVISQCARLQTRRTRRARTARRRHTAHGRAKRVHKVVGQPSRCALTSSSSSRVRCERRQIVATRPNHLSLTNYQTHARVVSYFSRLGLFELRRRAGRRRRVRVCARVT